MNKFAPFLGFEATALRFQNVKIVGATARSWCPVHQGHGKSHPRNRTLMMRQTNNGSIQIVCNAGCEHRDILAAVGLHYMNILPDHLRRGHSQTPHVRSSFGGWPCLQVLDAVLTEVHVCRICANKMIDGQTLDEFDHETLRHAHHVLCEAAQRISREVEHG